MGGTSAALEERLSTADLRSAALEAEGKDMAPMWNRKSPRTRHPEALRFDLFSYALF